MPKTKIGRISLKIASFASIILLVLLMSPYRSLALEAEFPNDPFFKDQWYLRQIQAPEAWAITHGSEAVLVAVIDGGVDISHPDLYEAIWVNHREVPGDGIDNDENGFIDDVNGWNFVREDADIRPMSTLNQVDASWAHGTMSASLIAGRGNNGFGIAGIAWNVKILPVVVLDADGFGNTRDIAEAIEYSIDMGADIVNLSIFGFEPDERIDQALERAREEDVLIVAAVGNDYSTKSGGNLDWHPTVPACSEEERDWVMGVTATDVLDQHAAYANTGTRCVDISAPGYGMVAGHPTEAIPHPEYEEEAEIRDIVFEVSGTSLSAPLVSGSAALVKSLRPAWGAKEIFAHLLATSDGIGGTQQLSDPAPLGWGRLNVGRAIQAIRPAEEAENGSSEKKSFFIERIIISGLSSLFVFVQ